MPRLDQLEKLLQLDPDDAFVLYAIAQEHAKAGDHDQALGFYDRAIGVTPDDAYCYYHKAASLITLGRTDDADAVLDAGLQAAGRAGDAKARGELEALRESLPR